MPGSDRLFVVEQFGKIYSFPRRDDVKSPDLAADLRKQIPGVELTFAIAFHPEFAKNRYCYVCYIKEPEREDGTHIARFRVTDTNPPTLDIASVTTMITWFSGGHNGCCLKFGRGMLGKTSANYSRQFSALMSTTRATVRTMRSLAITLLLR